MSDKPSLFKEPTFNFLLICSMAWLVGITCLLLAMTDFFRQTPFQGQYLMLWFLVIFSTAVVGNLAIKYVKQKKLRSSES